MAVVVDALDPADERAAHALEPGLLAQLADDGLGQQLAVLDPPAGHRPLPRGRPVAPPDQQQVAVVDGHGADAQLGPVAHGDSGHRLGGSAIEAAVHDDGPGDEAEASRRSSWWPGCRAGPGRRCRRSRAARHQAIEQVHHRLADADAAGLRLDEEVVDHAERPPSAQRPAGAPSP